MKTNILCLNHRHTTDLSLSSAFFCNELQRLQGELILAGGACYL
jgi:hypothetical protein